MFGSQCRRFLSYLGVWRKEYRPSDMVAVKGKRRSVGAMRTQSCKEEADVSLYRLFDQLNMAGYPKERVPSSLSSDVSQRCSVVSTSWKIEITRGRRARCQQAQQIRNTKRGLYGIWNITNKHFSFLCSKYRSFSYDFVQIAIIFTFIAP
jgi:hypothetical protein